MPAFDLVPPAWLYAFARAAAFSATAPLVRARGVPAPLRPALAIALMAAVAAREPASAEARFDIMRCATEALIGVAFGGAASIVAAAASVAGSMIDATLSAHALDREPLFGAGDGPFARLYGLAFAWSLLATGAFTQLCARFATASAAVSIRGDLPSLVSLVRLSTEAALSLAAPAIVGQMTATLIAAAVARAAPRVNGLVLASPLTTCVVLLTLLGGLSQTLPFLVRLASAAASAPPL